MNKTPEGIPYFDELLKLVAADEDTRRAFGENVHWGYWEKPDEADGGVDSFVEASRDLTRKTLSEAPLQDGLRILDVGCGFGGTIGLLNGMVRNSQLVGINIEERQLERARANVTPDNGNTVEFLRMDANELDFEEPFDVIFAVECIFHFDRPRFFGHIRRLLKPSGRFVITDFIVQPWKMPVFRLLDFLSRGSTLATYGDIDLSYSVRRYEQLAQGADLAMVRDLDISRNTLPTYAFVLEQIAKVPDPARAQKFRRATEGLEKATRWGILGYHILAFAPEAEG